MNKQLINTLDWLASAIVIYALMFTFSEIKPPSLSDLGDLRWVLVLAAGTWAFARILFGRLRSIAQ